VATGEFFVRVDLREKVVQDQTHVFIMPDRLGLVEVHGSPVRSDALVGGVHC
jgi:hypothetical protein